MKLIKVEEQEDNNMERLQKGEYITLDDNKEYYVVEIVEQGDNKYLYLVNDNPASVVVAEEIVENNKVFIETLDDQNKISEIVKIVLERLGN